jgi:hypothetical protein
MIEIASPRKYIINSIYNIRLNLSGEINILTKDITKSILIDDDMYIKSSSYANKLRINHPYINIDVVRELHELTIKLFSYNKKINNEDILNNIQADLEQLIDSICDTDGFNVRLNINGNIKTWYKVDKFIFLNNNHQICHKIIETIPLNDVSKIIGKLADILTFDLRTLLQKNISTI